MQFINDAAINAGDATLTGPLYSDPIDTSKSFQISLQSVAVAPNTTITGTMQLQYSNDTTTNKAFVTNWTNFPSGGSIAVSGAGALGLTAGFVEMCYHWVRVSYTKSTSSAGATITAQIKTSGW